MKRNFILIAYIFLLLFSGVLLSQNKENQNIVIQNDILKVEISPKGAELKSIKNIKTNTEFLWQANPEYWAQTSPVLFPFIGKSWNEEYYYNGKKFPMSPHGFASAKTFELINKTNQEAWFRLSNDAEIEKIYPFQFDLEIGFILKSDAVRVQWKVKNKDDKDLFFQIGGHTGFQLPNFDPQGKISGYIKLVTDKKVQYIVKEAGRYFKEKSTLHDLKTDADGLLPLTKEFFKDDAVVFENNQTKEIILLDLDKKPLVSVTTDTPVFALWTANHYAPFVCIEPWFGRADTENFTGDISQKKWIQHLLPKQQFTSGYTIKALR